MPNITSCHELGEYYQFIEPHEQKMHYYYRQTKNPKLTMYNLGLFYESKHNISEMIMFYEMASRLDNSNASYKLALYYQGINDIENMIKYYEIASSQGNIISMIKYGYYLYVNKKYEQMKKQYDMASRINNKNVDLIININEYLLDSKYDLRYAKKHYGILNQNNRAKYYKDLELNFTHRLIIFVYNLLLLIYFLFFY